VHVFSSSCFRNSGKATIWSPLFQIAAISPADINFEESLSTLRYGMSIDMHEALDIWPLSVLSCPGIAVQRPGHNPADIENVYRVSTAL
jgi:hypothetical protein